MRVADVVDVNGPRIGTLSTANIAVPPSTEQSIAIAACVRPVADKQQFNTYSPGCWRRM